ncbi:MAG: restriction endonuclease subunit S [Bacteroidales bacterium]|nr:restriction endonuclease subunit S [Bacteroidales bacterium]
MNKYSKFPFTEIATLIRGVSYDKKVASVLAKDGYIPVLRANNIQKSLVLADLVYVPSDLVKEEQMIRKGDIVLAMSSGSKDLVGKSAQANNDINAAFGTFCGLIRAKDNIDSKFLGLYFQTQEYRNFVSYQSQGVNICNLKKKDIESLQIPLPPLPTQHAIVSRIETLFAELDKGVEHLRTAQQQLKTYRQAVLNHWLNNDDGKWETVKLKDIADVNTGSTPKRGNNDYWENGTIPWITSGETNNQYITQASEFITAKAIAETNCKIIPKGSLVIAMYGEGKTRGKCAELSIDAATNQALASITFTDTEISKNFAKWFFEKNYQDMRLLSSGGVQPNLNLGIIKNMIIPFPPISEQQRIVKEIESRLSQATASETYIENALQQAEALRQSILKKAFSGELV